MLKNLLKLIMISRPISWPNTAFPFAAGYLVMGGGIDLVFILGTIFFLFPYNLLMYGVNDIFDYESDIRNPRKGGIEGMREQRAFHPTIAWASLIVNVPFAVYLLVVGNWLSALVFAALIFFVVAYSIAKLRFKERPVLDSITSSIHFVGPLVFALSLTSFSLEALPYLIAFFLWGMASHAFGAVQDIIPDRKGKLHSIATFFGAKRTVQFSALLYAIAAIIIVLQPYPYFLIGVVGLMYVFNIWKYLEVTDKKSGETNKAWKRFIYLNLFAGFIVTMCLIVAQVFPDI